MITMRGRLILLASFILVLTSSCYGFTSNYPFRAIPSQNFRPISRPSVTPLPHEFRFSVRQYGFRATGLHQNGDEVSAVYWRPVKILFPGAQGTFFAETFCVWEIEPSPLFCIPDRMLQLER